MDRLRQKGKKDKSSFIADVKSIKENLKIKEILRTVKINSSMRMKAPPGSKVMDNKDFIDNDDLFEGPNTTDGTHEGCRIDMPSATNLNVNLDNVNIGTNNEQSNFIDSNANTNINEISESSEILSISTTQLEQYLDVQLNEKEEEKLENQNEEPDPADIRPDDDSNDENAKECNTSDQFLSEHSEQSKEQFREQPAMLIKEQSDCSADKEFNTHENKQSVMQPTDNSEQVRDEGNETLTNETSTEQLNEDPLCKELNNLSQCNEKLQHEEQIEELSNELNEKMPEQQSETKSEGQSEELNSIQPDKPQQEEYKDISNVEPEDKFTEPPEEKSEEHSKELLIESYELESIDQTEQKKSIESEVQPKENCKAEPIVTIQSSDIIKEQSNQKSEERSEYQQENSLEEKSANHSDKLHNEESVVLENQHEDMRQEETTLNLTNELVEQTELIKQQLVERHKEPLKGEHKEDSDEQLKKPPEEPLEQQPEQKLEEVQTTSGKQLETVKDSVPNVSNIVLNKDTIDRQLSMNVPNVKSRDRKLSLDQTMLTRREGLSQSEVDLHSIGKLPLERKSSFFRKKMDSFLRNTTELFKKQSFNNKPTVQRRGSISVSLQSLNESTSGLSTNSDYNENMLHSQKEETPGSMTSLNSSMTLGRSSSSDSLCPKGLLNPMQGSEQSLASSQPTIHVTHALGDYPSNSVNSLNESLLNDSLLHNRAISMGSGLDTQTRLRRKKSLSSSWSKRVTWVASEGVNNYFRRMIKDEDAKNIPEHQAHPGSPASRPTENKTKGRRLSYQRAVSGEDPKTSRYQDSRRRPLGDHSEDNPQITSQLAEYMDTGIPELRGFEITCIEDEARNTLEWAQQKKNVEEFIVMEASAKQAVICELVSTEADYLQHLRVLVEVFMATAHALQDSGLMLEVATERIFFNIPDIYNANLKFWETTFHPMLQSAFETNTPFDAKLMEAGFSKISEIFAPYEFYAIHQPRAHDYLRSLSGNVDFSTYLSWCHRHKGCQRLQITDLLVKPIQRVTKYNLILKRILQLAEEEVEKNALTAMDHMVKTYVAELNRGVKQRQELDKADFYASAIDNFDVDYLQVILQEFKDEEMDEYNCRMFSQSNLRASMLNCHSQHARTVIHEGDLRFKDGSKEIEVRAILFTDMLIICKKQSKGSPYQYKMIRPKYMIDKLIDFPKYAVRNGSNELTFILIVMVDDLGSCYTCFTLTESSKDPNGPETLKLWDQKIKEAQYTYNLAVWLNCNPSFHISELDLELASEYGSSNAKQSDLLKQRQLSQEEYNIEREAKERVVTMLHRLYGPSFADHSPSHLSPSDMASMNLTGKDLLSIPMCRKVPGIDVLRNRWKRPSTSCSSRNSRWSSFQKSTSAASHDEYQPSHGKHIYRTGSSVEHTMPQLSTDDASSVTVKVMRESDSELELDSTNNTPSTSGYSRSPGHPKTLQVQNTVVALVHSLPDLSLVAPPPRQNQPRRSPSPMSASEKLYQSHQELLKSRLNVHSQYLTLDNRGISYPPSSPGRASLKRGLAFSYSFQKPSLSKMGHVASQGNLDQIEAEQLPLSIPVPIQVPVPVQPPKEKEKTGFVAKFLPGTSSDKVDKEKERQKEIVKQQEMRLKMARKNRKRRTRRAEEDP